MNRRRRAPRDALGIGWRGILLLVAVVAAIVILLSAPWMGWGLALLLPSPAAQVVVGVSIPLALVVLFVIGTFRPRGKRFPPALAATMAGLAATMWLLAPFGRRGGPAGAPAAAESVVALVLTTYLSWPLLAVVIGGLGWWDTRRRRGDDAVARPAAHARHLPPLRSWLVAASLPVAVAVSTVTAGLLGGPPPVDPPAASPGTPGTTAEGFGPPRRVQVPELAGTLLRPQLATVERAVGSEHGLRLAEQVGDPSIERLWSVVGSAAEQPGAPLGFVIEVAVAELVEDPAVVPAHLPTAVGSPLGGGWQRVEEADSEKWVTAAVVQDHTVFRLRIIHGTDDEARNAALLALTEQLTAERLAALAAATRPAA